MRVALAAALLSSLLGRTLAGKPVMTESDVVFMYTAKDHAFFDEYRATWIAWGGGPAREGIHSTGSFWCLTAGARLLHENPVLREAVARDIQGRPIKVPWLLDHVHEGTPSWFGCTNNPAFKAHLRKECLNAVKDKPDGLHIDDPSGSYAPASYGGGCFCDYCMAGFREYLLKHARKRLKALVGPDACANFDYRETVKKHAQTREEYLKIQDRLPLRREFLDFQLEAAVQNIRELRDLARSRLGPGMTMSVNAYYGGPGGHFVAFVPVITHMVAEAEHDAASGVAGLSSVISGYRQAEAIRRPFAATASGGDWAFIKKNGAVDLVKIWIALSYACGQRLMVPHPEMQWCHTAELGTHWYRAPADEFSPIYRFVRENARLFDGFVTVGPLAVPRKPPRRYSTQKDRDALAAALLKGNPAPLQAGESVWVFPRAGRSGGFVAHLLNVDYRQEGDWIAPKADLVVEIPAKLAKKKYTRAALHSYDRPAQDLSVETDKKKMVVRVPELRLWSLLEFKN